MINTNEISKLGFGLMRLPKIGAEFDVEQIKMMVDSYIKAGGNYFDTAYIYQGSEAVSKEVLISRYPRESFKLATKMYIPQGKPKTKDEMEVYFNEQLEKTGAEYFDFYLMHGVASEKAYRTFCDSGFFEFVAQKKADGKIRHNGFSFHGDPKLLNLILDEQPQTEFVQIQINYADWDSTVIYSKELYKISMERNIPIIVMEPVKGGILANVSSRIEEIFKKAEPNKSIASWAFRYVASLDGVMTILSGMSNMEQMNDNLSTFDNFQPLSKDGQETISKVIEIMYGSKPILCTSCRYCIEGCPKQIDIPKIFSLTNSIRRTPGDRLVKVFYSQIPEDNNASACIACKKCEKICPQHLPIVDLLKEAAVELTKDN
ncbi:Fe-S oxidoreductase [Candidatus Epulonipiscium fishelsonii]|nr:Fe-S oxidoreductase [Epulopiscium sp. SCG-C06WGA-EpuloA1]